jgi:prephenate dehydrogenase
MIYALDAIPIRMSAVDHDLHVARLSHLPTLLANLLAAMGQNLPSVHIGGGSWRDLTRVAGANPVLWEQILRHNRDEVLSAVGELRASLAEVECALAANNSEDLKRLIDHQS